MKLNVLVDNNTFIDMYYLGEPAVSYYIEDGDTKLLFDVGYSDAFIKNATKMHIDLNEVNKIVISHGHNDHTGGFRYLELMNKDIELIAHPLAFKHKVYNGEDIGSPLSQNDIANNYHLKLSAKPYALSDNLIYLGEIPVSQSFEERYTIGKISKEDGECDDDILDDTAIVYKNDKGLFIITGCSHSGICNIIEYAKQVCNDERIYGVIGGFHLFDVDERLIKTIDYLKVHNIKYLYPCHCVSLKAKLEMAKSIEINEVGVGLELEI